MTLARRLGAFVTIASLVWSSSLASAGKPVPPVFGTEVTLVLLPVFVADGEGRAMRGLSGEDFELYEDGKRTKVVSFRYVDTTSEDEQETIRQASAARRRFLLLFDKSFTELGGLNRAQRAAAQFVRTGLAPSDLAAVATFDVDKGIRIVANFTEDRALLAHAVATLGATNLTRISDPLGLAADLSITDLALPGILDSTQVVSESALTGVLAVLARRMRAAEEEQYRRHVQTLTGSLEELAKALRNVDGRKQIVYFSAGFDSRLLIGQTGSEQRSAAESIAQGRLWEVDGATRYGDSRLLDLLSTMTRNISHADAVIHSVDVTGLGSDRSLSRTMVTVDPQRDTGGREGLNFLAAETGGRFFKDATDLGPVLGEMLEMTSRYYLLGFQPVGSKGPGAFHKVKVKVARKGAKLSHRAGYYERTPVPLQTPLQRKFEAAQLVMTGAGANELPFASLCLPFPAAADRQTLGLVIQVPKESLRWTAGRTTSLEVYGYAVAEDGTVHDHIAQLARIDPADADPDGVTRGLSFYGTLAVTPGKYTVRLMLQERESGKSGVQVIDVTVPPYDPKMGVLLPPVLMEDPGRWVGLGMSRNDHGQGPAFPFQVGDTQFLPRASLETQPGASETLVLLAYEPVLPGDPAAPLQIRSSLRDREGRLVPAGLLRIEKVHRGAPGRRTYVLGYVTDPLAAGDYTLRIGIGEGGSQLEAYSLLRVRPRS
jgi:VWFA-related protein